jgi:hypothetical protein
MPLTEHQRRLFEHMIQLIDGYRRGGVTFSSLVGELEGALDAAELQADLARQWYQIWTPLEITRAVRGENVQYKHVAREVDALRSFIQEQL